MGGDPRCFMCRKPTSASALSPISSSFRSRLKMNLFKELVFSPAFIERLNASAPLESQMSDSSCRFWGQGEETDICSGCSVTLEEAWNWTKELTAIQLRVEESVRRTRESVGRNVLNQEDSISDGIGQQLEVDFSHNTCEDIFLPELKENLKENVDENVDDEVDEEIAGVSHAGSNSQSDEAMKNEPAAEENKDDKDQDMDENDSIEEMHNNFEVIYVDMNEDEEVENAEVISSQEATPLINCQDPLQSILKTALEENLTNLPLQDDEDKDISSLPLHFQIQLKEEDEDENIPTCNVSIHSMNISDTDEESNFSNSEFNTSENDHSLTLSEMLVPITQLKTEEDISRLTPTKKLENPNPFVYISAACRATADAVLKSINKIPTKRKSYNGNGRFNPLIPLQEVYKCQEKECLESEEPFTTKLRNYFLRHLRLHKIGKYNPNKSKQKGGYGRLDVPIADEYRCQHCPDRIFSDRKLFFSHQNYHRKLEKMEGKVRQINSREDKFEIPFMEDDYTCQQCKKVYHNRRDYICHLNYHKRMKGIYRGVGMKKKKQTFAKRIPLSSDTKTYECEICNDGRIFYSERAHKSHIRYHEMLKRDGIDRPVRKQWEPAKDSWQAQIPIQDQYQCDKCPSRMFTVRESFLGHLSYHKNLQKRGIDRVILSKDEIMNQSLAKKEEEEEEDEGPYICQICPNPEVEGSFRTFTSKQTFTTHQNSHEKVRLAEGADRPLRPPRNMKRKLTITPSLIPHQEEPYICQTCNGRTFDSRKTYIGHVNYHERLKKNKCDRAILSKEEFLQTPGLFRAKVVRANVNVTHKCEICEDRVFNNESRFKAHMSYHKRLKEINGGVERPIKVSTNWKNSIPYNQTEYVCAACPNHRIFTKRHLYIRHMEGHKKLERQNVMKTGGSRSRFEPQSCVICPDRFFTKAKNYRRHMNRHKQKQQLGQEDGPLLITRRDDIPIQDIYVCTKCPDQKSFQSRPVYLSHLRYHHSGNRSTSSSVQHNNIPFNDVYTCDKCDKKFDVRLKFLAHLLYHKKQANAREERLKNPGSGNNYCRICNRLFLNFNSLRVHRKTHAKEGIRTSTTSSLKMEVSKKLNCGYCPKSNFESLESLEKHVNAVHAAELSVVVCPCGKCFTTKEGHEAHKLVGCSKRTANCTLCGRYFSSQTTLQAHVRSHTGEKPFMCEKCGDRFSLKMILKKHEQRGKCKSLIESNSQVLEPIPDIVIKYEEVIHNNEQEQDYQ